MNDVRGVQILDAHEQLVPVFVSYGFIVRVQGGGGLAVDGGERERVKGYRSEG
jgi:hypothetical protein